MANTPLIRIKRVPGAQCGGVVHDAYFIVKVRVSHDFSSVKRAGARNSKFETRTACMLVLDIDHHG